MMKPIRILLADDHALVRAGFRMLLEALPEVEIVAEAASGREVLQLAREHEPDIVLMDIAMPGLNGLEATVQLAVAFPGVRVIILSMHANEEYVLRALRAGAVGYLLKDSGPDELEMAIRAVAAGDTYLSPPVSKHVISDYVRLVRQEPDSLERLTPRQREVLQLIAEGHTTPEIAEILHVSVKTAQTHRAQLMDRLGIHDVAGLVRHAIQMGLVSAEG
jgi:DNA-binding NarL/FixJ family response regulator